MLEPLTLTQIGFMTLGAVVLGLSMSFSFLKSMLIMTRDTENESTEEIIERNQEASHIQYAGFVNAIGFITYLMILSGSGRILLNGEEFIYIQYIEWIISTPIIIMNTANTLAASQPMVVSLILYDVLMIITGFCATVSSTIFWRYFFYIISSLYWIAIFRILFFQQGIITKKLKEYEDVVLIFDRLMKITVFAWGVYPILFLVGPNGSLVSGSTGFLEVAVCLDVVAKGVWGFLQTINSRSMKDAMDKYEGKKSNHSLLSCLVALGCVHPDVLTPRKEDPASDLAYQMALFQQLQKTLEQNQFTQSSDYQLSQSQLSQSQLSQSQLEQLSQLSQQPQQTQQTQQTQQAQHAQQIQQTQQTQQTQHAQQAQQLPQLQQTQQPQQLPQLQQTQQPQLSQQIQHTQQPQQLPQLLQQVSQLPPISRFVQVNKNNMTLQNLLPTPQSSPRQILRALPGSI